MTNAVNPEPKPSAPSQISPGIARETAAAMTTVAAC